MIDDFSILFTNRNTLSFIQGALASFLDYYPTMKDRIVVFDDESSDGSIEWLAQNNIKTITYKNFKNYKVIFIKKYGDAHRYRCFNYMMQDALAQIISKYVIVCDSDIVFLKKGFLEKYDSLFKQDSELKLIGPIYSDVLMNLKDINKTKYKSHVTYNQYKQPELERVFPYFYIANLDFFKKEGIPYDSVSDPEYNIIFNPEIYIEYMTNYQHLLVDTGVDWIYQIKERNIKYIDIKEDQYGGYTHYYKAKTTNPDCFIYHICGGASGKFKEYTASHELYPRLLREATTDPKLLPILSKYHPWIETNLKQYINTKSNL